MKNPAAAPTTEHNDDLSWFGMGAAPFAVALHQVGGYVLAHIACQSGLNWPLHVLSLLSLALALAGVAVALRDGSRNRGALDGAAVSERSRFLALLALGGSLLLALVIAGQAIAEFYFDPCQR
jgi:hypothetical protein